MLSRGQAGPPRPASGRTPPGAHRLRAQRGLGPAPPAAPDPQGSRRSGQGPRGEEKGEDRSGCRCPLSSRPGWGAGLGQGPQRGNGRERKPAQTGHPPAARHPGPARPARHRKLGKAAARQGKSVNPRGVQRGPRPTSDRGTHPSPEVRSFHQSRWAPAPPASSSHLPQGVRAGLRSDTHCRHPRGCPVSAVRPRGRGCPARVRPPPGGLRVLPRPRRGGAAAGVWSRGGDSAAGAPTGSRPSAAARPPRPGLPDPGNRDGPHVRGSETAQQSTGFVTWFLRSARLCTDTGRQGCQLPRCRVTRWSLPGAGNTPCTRISGLGPRAPAGQPAGLTPGP